MERPEHKTTDIVERSAQAIAYHLGYTWGSSALNREYFMAAAKAVLRQQAAEIKRLRKDIKDKEMLIEGYGRVLSWLLPRQ